MTSASPPLRFCFGLHLHQPVGNFGHVFEQHVRDVYRPFIERLIGHDFFPVSLHISGPLLDWLEENDARYLDTLAGLASDGRLEMLLGGYYEPVLAALPRRDRIEQIEWMRDALRRRFGVEARGLWLTERVWEPDIASDLAAAGVSYALVDDRHFLVSGFRRDQLHQPWRTEHDAKSVALFAIDERLRYLVPFRPAHEGIDYLRSLRAQGHSLAVLCDDGEKFGGWPGTVEWVYRDGWLDSFLNGMRSAMDAGEIVLSRLDDALAEVPSGGLAYLGTASYREMEGWSLPAASAVRLSALERELGAERMSGADGALVRGAHWRNFLVKYREANRMHGKMLALSLLCRERGDPPAGRRAIGRAQCNDAYWHGVFGGLYLPFLRATVWRNLAEAERELRRDEGIACELRDIDGDGHDELWIHSDSFSAIVSPRRGGAVEELTRFADGVNVADALTRRREAYHIQAYDDAMAAAEPVSTSDSTPSIHDLEHRLRLETLPPVDLDDRALFVERVLAGDVTMDRYRNADYRPVASGAEAAMTHHVETKEECVDVTLLSHDRRLRKRLSFRGDGSLRVSLGWEAAQFPGDAIFTTELSCARETTIVSASAEVWSHQIETVAKSERGLDRTVQGVSYLLRWPVGAGRAEIELPPPPG